MTAERSTLGVPGNTIADHIAEEAYLFTDGMEVPADPRRLSSCQLPQFLSNTHNDTYQKDPRSH